MLVSIEVDPTVTPVVQHVRRLPIALRGPVEDELKSMLEMDIIETVEVAQSWVSPMSFGFKNQGKAIRICADLRRLNKAVKRGYFPIPTFEDVTSK